MCHFPNWGQICIEHHQWGNLIQGSDSKNISLHLNISLLMAREWVVNVFGLVFWDISHTSPPNTNATQFPFKIKKIVYIEQLFYCLFKNRCSYQTMRIRNITFTRLLLVAIFVIYFCRIGVGAWSHLVSPSDILLIFQERTNEKLSAPVCISKLLGGSLVILRWRYLKIWLYFWMSIWHYKFSAYIQIVSRHDILLQTQMYQEDTRPRGYTDTPLSMSS